MTYAVQTHALTRTFGSFTAVDRVDLAVEPGQVYGYLGLNGAGKSTTIKVLTTLLAPTSGRALVEGLDVARDPLAVRRVVGLVGDEGGESRPSWTPRELLGYFARLRALPDGKGRVEEALDAVGLDPAWRGKALGNHSTGMKRRVEIARALLGRPRVLFLDEPTRGLDLPAKRETWDLLRRLAEEEGVTVFLSSHEVAEIQALCRSLAVIAKGRLAYEGPAAKLGADPQAFESSLLRLLAPGAAARGIPKLQARHDGERA